MRLVCHHPKRTVVQETHMPHRRIYPIEQCQDCGKLRYVGHSDERWMTNPFAPFSGFDQDSGHYLAP